MSNDADSQSPKTSTRLGEPERFTRTRAKSCRRDFIKRCGVQFGKKVREVYGFFSSQSFWKAGSDRKGSQSGSSLKRAGVTDVP
jgi:hypothetical protein